ncbi:MAG: protein phosphatase 2C domain-containing protein [Ruminococcaceae bacterium]|nr:protein phosphatase 2C domain-containing protein [Oscillospiraceae bacterium]
MDNEDIRPVRINGVPLAKIERVDMHEQASQTTPPTPEEIAESIAYEDLIHEEERKSVLIDEEPPKLTDREVMEHTASIWQYKPISDNGVELHTECHAKYTDADIAEVICARARGKKHKHDGSNCDDWFETAVIDGCVIAVVADGAGSKPLSRIGARLCCEGAVEYLKEKLAQLLKDTPTLKGDLASDMTGAAFMAACGKIAPLVQDAARRSFDRVIEHLKTIYNDKTCLAALGRNPVLADLSSTFLAAIVIPLEVDGHRESFAVTAQIGDGCICGVNSGADAASCLKLLGEPDSGAFSGETEFLSERTINDNVIAGKTRISRGRSDVFMLMSDGVADDYFPAAPMMKRLYLDLCLNGILPMQGECTVPEQPEPIRFRSVSMSQRSVELQYAKQLIPEDGGAEAVDMLWDKRDALKCHSLEAYRISLGDTAQERLLTWLDNYNERGSFDDRTLVIIKIKE